MEPPLHRPTAQGTTEPFRSKVPQADARVDATSTVIDRMPRSARVVSGSFGSGSAEAFGEIGTPAASIPHPAAVSSLHATTAPDPAGTHDEVPTRSTLPPVNCNTVSVCWESL